MVWHFSIGILSISIVENNLITEQNNFYVGNTECTVKVLSVTRTDEISAVVDNVTISGKTYSGKVSLYLSGSEPFSIEPGQEIKING